MTTGRINQIAIALRTSSGAGGLCQVRLRARGDTNTDFTRHTHSPESALPSGRQAGCGRHVPPPDTHHHRLVCFSHSQVFIGKWNTQLVSECHSFSHGPLLHRTFEQLSLRGSARAGHTCFDRRSIALPTEQRNCCRDFTSRWG